MSFSSETKAELCREKLSHLECVQAEAYGVLLFCNVYTPNEVRITTRPWTSPSGCPSCSTGPLKSPSTRRRRHRDGGLSCVATRSRSPG